MTLEQLFKQIWARKVPFFGVFFVAVLVTYAFLSIIDFIPEPVDEVNTETIEEEVKTDESEIKPVKAESSVVTNPLPTKIIFDSLGTETTVLNPQSSDIPTLDQALLKGVVRHPDSVDFSEPGNMLILGHSSYLPNVFNKNFQAFNDVQKLTWGDKIRVQSADKEYVYRVDRVYEAKASDIFVPNTPGQAKLTLATCNVLGSKEDRFIVEATLIGSYPLTVAQKN